MGLFKRVINRCKKRTVSRDLILGLTLAIGFVVTILGAAYYTYSTLLFQRELNARATHITEEIAHVLALPLWNFDYDTIQQIAHAYLNTEYLVGVQIKTDSDEIVFDNLLRDRNNLVGRSKKVLKDNSSVGQVELLFTKEGMEQAQRTMIRTMAIIIFSVIAVIILGTYFIMKSLLNRPLDQLIKGIRTIASGEYRTSLPLVPQDDINTIINEVNVMAGHIARRTQQLRSEIIERAKAEKELAISEKKYRSIFENAVEGIFQTTLQGRFISATPSMANMLGYDSPDELINTVTDIESELHVDPHRRKELLRLLQDEDKVTNFECRFYRKDKRVIWASVQARALRDNSGQLTRVEGFVQDISKRKLAEEALQNSYKELERRVEERTAELRITNEELKKAKGAAEAATRARGEFLANMSHEIRNPMNGVIAAADLALDEKLPAKVEHYLEIIHASAHSLLALINDILDFSKVEAGKLDLETRPFRLDEVLGRAMEIFGHKAAEKGIELLIDIGPEMPQALIGDPLRLQQILTNLVSNAIKFTETGGVIIGGIKGWEDSPKRGETDQIMLAFFVKDTGMGMAPEFLQKLFKPFSQAEASTTRKYGGTGLGLSICKQLVNMMDGDIWVESKLGKGSTFNFTARFGRQTADQELKFISPPDVQKLNVLVVDDCADSRIIIGKMLKSLGFQVESVSSGNASLSKLKENRMREKPFDLIIMDWLMPHLDGIETSRKIRQDLKLALPIIMITAFGKQTEKVDAEKTGINAFLTKPISPSTLFNAIMEAFGKEALEGVKAEKPIVTEVSIYKKQLRGARVLVAEDNPTNQEIALAILEKAGIAAEIAATGKEAVAAIRSGSFDAVLMDIQMPEMDGYEATRTIRKDPKFSSLPIIAMTAHAMKGDEEKCLKSGMDGYISKPISQDRLFGTLWKLIRPKEKPFRVTEPEAVSPEAEELEAAVAKTGELPAKLPGINIQDALSALRIDTNTFKRILAGFLRNNKETMNKVREALDREEWESLRLLAHSLKGSAANIGANTLQTAAQELESASREQAVKPAVMDKVETSLTQVLDSLQSLVGIPKTEIVHPKEIRLDPAQIMPVLKQLANALELADPEEIRKHMEAAREHLDRFTLQDLENDIDNYDYDQALEALAGIAEKIGWTDEQEV